MGAKPVDMNKTEILELSSLPKPLLIALGVLVLAGMVMLFLQAFDVMKKRKMPGRVRPWGGTVEGFCLLVALVVLTFLSVQVLSAGVLGATGGVGNYAVFAVGIAGQVAALVVIFAFLPKANPAFGFQAGDMLTTPLAENSNRNQKSIVRVPVPGFVEDSLKKIFGTWGAVPSFAGAVVLVGAASLAVQGLAKILIKITGSSFGLDEQQQVVEILVQHREDWLFLSAGVLTTVVLAPVLEELFFRGLVFPFLKSRVPPVLAVCITGIFFGGIHFCVAALFPLAIFGAYLCLLYEKTGDIRVPIAVHALFNLNTFVTILTTGAG